STPNQDLMRAVQVADSRPAEQTRLALLPVWTYTLREGRLVEKREADREYRVFVEALTPGTEVRVSIRTDDFLLSPAAGRDMQLPAANRQPVQQLAQTCNEHARAQIAQERGFYGAHGPEAVAAFYEGLEAQMDGLPAGALVLNVGWGVG